MEKEKIWKHFVNVFFHAWKKLEFLLPEVWSSLRKWPFLYLVITNEPTNILLMVLWYMNAPIGLCSSSWCFLRKAHLKVVQLLGKTCCWHSTFGSFKTQVDYFSICGITFHLFLEYALFSYLGAKIKCSVRKRKFRNTFKFPRARVTRAE